MSNPRLQVDIGASIEQFQRAMGKVEGRLKTMSSNVATIGKQISLGLTAPITAFGVTSVAAFDTQAQAEGRLRAALQANGREVDNLFSKYSEFASQLQQISTTGDEATLAMLATAESMGLTGDAAIRAVQNALSMEAAFGVSAQSAIRMTSALEQGDAQLLTRYIPALRQTEDQAERVAIAQEILGNAFGQVTTQATTGLGPLKQAQNAFGDLQEQIGAIIAEAINPFLQRAKVLFETLQEQPEEVRRRFVTMAGVIAGVGPVLVALSVAIKGVAFVVGGLSTALGVLRIAFYKLLIPLAPILIKIAAIVAIVGALFAAMYYLSQNVDAFKALFINAWNNIKRSVINAIAGMARGIANFLEKVPGMGAVSEFFDGVSESMAENAEAVENVAQPAFMTFSEFTQSLSDDLAGLRDRAAEATKEFLGLGKAAEEATAPAERSQIGRAGFSPVRLGPTPDEAAAGVIERVEPETLGFLDKLMESMQANADVAKQYMQTLIDGFSHAIVNGERFGDVLKQIGKQLASKALSKIIDAVLFGGIGAAGTGFFGSGGGLFGSILPGIFGAGAAPVMGASPVAGSSIALTGEFTLNGQDLRLALDRANQFAGG